MLKIIGAIILSTIIVDVLSKCYSKGKDCVEDDNMYACVSCSDAGDFLFIRSRQFTGECKSSTFCKDKLDTVNKWCISSTTT